MIREREREREREISPAASSTLSLRRCYSSPETLPPSGRAASTSGSDDRNPSSLFSSTSPPDPPPAPRLATSLFPADPAVAAAPPSSIPLQSRAPPHHSTPSSAPPTRPDSASPFLLSPSPLPSTAANPLHSEPEPPPGRPDHVRPTPPLSGQHHASRSSISSASFLQLVVPTSPHHSPRLAEPPPPQYPDLHSVARAAPPPTMDGSPPRRPADPTSLPIGIRVSPRLRLCRFSPGYRRPRFHPVQNSFRAISFVDFSNGVGDTDFFLRSTGFGLEPEVEIVEPEYFFHPGSHE